MRRIVAAAALLLVFGAGTAPADDPVDRFRELEERLAKALQTHDEAALESLLRAEYVLTVAVADGLVQVDRATWLRNALTRRVLHEFQIHEIIVREYGDTAVVGVRYTARATLDGELQTTDYFLNDVWVRSTGGWQISARYSSRPEPVSSKNEPIATPGEGD